MPTSEPRWVSGQMRSSSHLRRVLREIGFGFAPGKVGLHCAAGHVAAGAVEGHPLDELRSALIPRNTIISALRCMLLIARSVSRKRTPIFSSKPFSTHWSMILRCLGSSASSRSALIASSPYSKRCSMELAKDWR